MNWQQLQTRTNAAVLAAFGEDVVLDGTTLRADFNEAYAVGDVGSHGMASTRPAVVLQSASVPAGTFGKSCVVRGVVYVVQGVEPDGCGLTALLLEHSA